jgi:hypothetical protein
MKTTCQHNICNKSFFKIWKSPFKVPLFKLRSELETEQILHKWNVIARRRQFAQVTSNSPILSIPTETIKYWVELGKRYLESKLK